MLHHWKSYRHTHTYKGRVLLNTHTSWKLSLKCVFKNAKCLPIIFKRHQLWGQVHGGCRGAVRWHTADSEEWESSALQALNFLTFREQFILSHGLNIFSRVRMAFDCFSKELHVVKHSVFHVILFKNVLCSSVFSWKTKQVSYHFSNLKPLLPKNKLKHLKLIPKFSDTLVPFISPASCH